MPGVARAETGEKEPLRFHPGTDLGNVIIQRADVQCVGSGQRGSCFRVGNRSGRTGLRWIHGPSMRGEFFLPPESAWGLELRLTR